MDETYTRVIREINHRYDPHFDSIRHIDRKCRNNLIESDHATLKRLLGYRQSFRTSRSAKPTLSGLEQLESNLETNVREHPLQWFLGALGVGLVLTMLMRKGD